MKNLLLLATAVTLFFSANIFAQDNYYIGLDATCTGCHGPIVEAWEGTGHAIAQDSVSNDHYGYSCLECHNTGWNPDVTNYGADEYVDSTDNNGYEITDEAQWAKVKNVTCESCHGPVGNEDGSMDNAHMGRVTDYSADNCGVCHQDAHHPYMEEWQESKHAESEVSWFTREANGQCYYCHYAQDFIAFLEDPDYDYTVEQQGELAVITCATCHDPHGNENPGSLRMVGEGQIVCDVCHAENIVDEVNVEDTPHHTTSEVFAGSDKFGYQYPGETYSNSAHTFVLAEEKCAACHVHQTPFDGTVTATGHTFEPRTESCAQEGCHPTYYTDVDTSNAETRFDFRGVQSNVDSLMQVLGAELAQANAEDSLTDAFKQANYNLKAAAAEGSMGIHNTKLVTKILQDAIADFNPTTGVETDSDLVPEVYELNQNYPNPFNPTTTIKFSIPQAGNVNLTVYDAVGKEVAMLVNENVDAGEYNVQWNAAGFSSGVYFYRLEAGNFVQVNKMLLLK